MEKGCPHHRPEAYLSSCRCKAGTYAWSTSFGEAKPITIWRFWPPGMFVHSTYSPTSFATSRTFAQTHAMSLVRGFPPESQSDQRPVSRTVLIYMRSMRLGRRRLPSSDPVTPAESRYQPLTGDPQSQRCRSRSRNTSSDLPRDRNRYACLPGS